MKALLLNLLISSFVINLAGASALLEDHIPPEPVIGCLLNNETFVPVGHTVPAEGCAELRCVKLEDEHLGLAHAFCPDPVHDPPPNCRRLPRPNTSYPDCCVDVIQCHQMVAVPVHVVYDSSNITKMDADSKQKLLRLLNLIDEGDQTSMQMSNMIEDAKVDGFPEKSLKDEKVRKFVRDHLYKKESKSA